MTTEKSSAYTTYFAIVKAGLKGEQPRLVTYPLFNDLSYLDEIAFVEELKKEVNDLYRSVVRENLNKDQKELEL